MSINKIEIQDGGGNVYYPKTSIDSVIYSDNTSIEEKIRILEYRLNELKSQLANSINNKTGSSLTSNSTVDEMAAIINSIKTLEQATADANATASNILVDKTAYVNGAKITGTMPNKGAVTASLNCGGSYTIPAGYHNGSGKVTANSLSSQTSANATAKDIIKGKTAWVNGSKITGTATIQSLGGANYKEGTTGSISKTTPVTINLSFVPKTIEAIRYSAGSVSGRYFVDYEKSTYLKDDGTSTNATTIINNSIVVSGTSVTFKRYNVSSGDIYYEYKIWG